jgi:hypothetical protein
VWITPNRPDDAALKHKADTFVECAVSTIALSRAWTQRSAIVVVTDENDFTGNEETGRWESAAGCCDSPHVPAADPRISADRPGGTYGGGLIAAIVVTASGPRHFVDSTHIGHGGDRANGVVPMWPLSTARWFPRTAPTRRAPAERPGPVGALRGRVLDRGEPRRSAPALFFCGLVEDLRVLVDAAGGVRVAERGLCRKLFHVLAGPLAEVVFVGRRHRCS